MKIYVPTPGLKKRVRSYNVERTPSDKGWRSCDDQCAVFWDAGEGDEWYRDEAAARAEADAATRRRLAKLQLQIAKLKGFLGGGPDA